MKDSPRSCVFEHWSPMGPTVLCVWILDLNGWCSCGRLSNLLKVAPHWRKWVAGGGPWDFLSQPYFVSALYVTGCLTLVQPHSLPWCALVSQTVTRISPYPLKLLLPGFSTTGRSRADSECQHLAEGNHPLPTCLRSKLFHYDICWSQWASRVNANFLSSHHRSFDGVDSPWRSLLRIQFLC